MTARPPSTIRDRLPDTQSPGERVEQAALEARNRLRWISFGRGVLRAGLYLAAALLAATALRRVGPLDIRPWVAAAGVAFVGWTIATLWRQRAGVREGAHALDHAGGTARDCVATSLEFNTLDSPAALLTAERAAQHVSTHGPREAVSMVPERVTGAELAVLGTMLAAALVLGTLVEPWRSPEDRASDALARYIEEVDAAIEAYETAAGEDAALRAAATRLRQSTDPAQAASGARELREALRERRAGEEALNEILESLRQAGSADALAEALAGDAGDAGAGEEGEESERAERLRVALGAGDGPARDALEIAIDEALAREPELAAALEPLRAAVAAGNEESIASSLDELARLASLAGLPVERLLLEEEVARRTLEGESSAVAGAVRGGARIDGSLDVALTPPAGAELSSDAGSPVTLRRPTPPPDAIALVDRYFEELERSHGRQR